MNASVEPRARTGAPETGASLGGALAGLAGGASTRRRSARHRLLARQIPLRSSSRASARSARNTSCAATSPQTRSGLRLSAAFYRIMAPCLLKVGNA